MNKYLNANAIFSKFSRDYMDLKRDLPIRPSEMGVITIITKREGDYTPLMIAELLGVSKPMIAAHLAVLEEKGYIYKEISACDKRSFYVRPTEKAKELADETEAKRSECLREMEAILGETRFDELVAMLDEVQDVLKKRKGE